jgi:hypothetical protein
VTIASVVRGTLEARAVDQGSRPASDRPDVRTGAAAASARQG